MEDDDTGSGIWFNAGVYVTLGRHFNLGAQYRYSQAEVELYGVEPEAGGNHLGLMLGYHF